MTAPQAIVDLVEKFDRNVDSYRSGGYNETQIRLEFINPFFKALGWDVENEKGSLGLYREVVHEDAVKVKKATKNPDYGFYVGRTQKFFVEAKKPSVNLENDIRAAFQLRSYGWSAGLPISLLTDFEEFAIYDCRIEPSNTDSPKVGLLRHFTYDKYIDHWDEIAALFSREAVLGGSLERYIESKKKARGTITVDEAFLREIDSWREILARNIYERNPGLSVRELNSSVQNTIDRIVFLRICEDRGIERFGQLKGIVKGEKAVYTMLVELFKGADDKYNSGLFHFGGDPGRIGEPDRLALSLKIDDEVLSEMIENLYPPRSPYRFSVIPAEILGHVYEQFLGKVISLGEDGGVEVEYKPEVRKAGGVYYTPTYIVDYIVENTVGKLLEGLTPTAVSDLRILDPACGSGSFLIGAYQRLLDWHLEWYTSHLVPLLEAGKAEGSKDVQALLPAGGLAGNGAAGIAAGAAKKRGRGRPRKNSSAAATASASSAQKDGSFPIFQAEGGEWRLATAERKRILLKNIYGVDIDLAAVEVTKLSLQLKVLEGENQETLSRQLTLFKERALPDLGENIKCGNSLIGPDFYDRQTSLFDEEEMYRVNAFNWDAEFPDIMGSGGFDAVIGNPPWGAEYNQDEKGYLRKKYEDVHVRTPESFNYFINRTWNCTKQLGVVGLIIPSSFLNQYEFWKTRKQLVESASIYRVCNLGNGIFQKVTAPCCIIIFMAKTYSNQAVYLDLRKSDRCNLGLDLLEERNGRDASQIGLESDSYLFQISNNTNLIQKCYIWLNLKDIAEDVATGVSSGLDVAYVYKLNDIKRLNLECELLRKLIIGGEIDRYSLTPKSGKQIIYVTPETKIEDFPNCYSALLPHYDRLKKRREAANGKIPWYSLNWPRRTKLFDNPKILIRQTSDRIRAALDLEQWYCLKSAIIIQLKSDSKVTYEYLLALLNSKLMNYLYDYQVGEQSRVFPEVKPVQLFKLPIRTIDFSDPEDVARHDKMVALVERMLDLHRRLSESKTGHEKTLLSRQIDGTDRQIDSLVSELYGLSEEEIAIVEEATK